jgi:hypothetical protein
MTTRFIKLLELRGLSPERSHSRWLKFEHGHGVAVTVTVGSTRFRLDSLNRADLRALRDWLTKALDRDHDVLDRQYDRDASQLRDVKRRVRRLSSTVRELKAAA